MGVKVTSRTYRNQFHPSDQATDWLLGNVGDWQQLRVGFEVSVRFDASDRESIGVDIGNRTFTLNNGKKWSDYGFDIGDAIEVGFRSIINDGNGNGDDTLYLYSGTIAIVNLYGPVMEHDRDFGDTPLSDVSVIPTNRGTKQILEVFVRADKEPEGLKFRYAHLTNEGFADNNLASLIDGSVAEFSLAGLDTLPMDSPREMDPDGIQSGMAIDGCWVERHGPDDGTYRYTVVCNFMLSGLFGQPSDLEEGTPPDILLGTGSLTDNFEILVFPEWNNPNTVIRNDLDHTERLGNTGWFNENFNGLDNNFTVERTAYFDGGGNPLAQLDHTRPTSVEVEVSGIGGLSPDSEFNIGFAWIPQDRDDYHNKMAPYHHNLLMNTGRPRGYDMDDGGSLNLGEGTGATVFPGYSFGEARMDLRANGGTIFNAAGPDRVIIKVQFIPNAHFTEFFQERGENDRKYILWVSVADHGPRINFSNRVSLLVDHNDMVKEVPPAGPYPGMSNRFIEHPQHENVTGVQKYSGFLEDDLLARILFKVDTTRDIFITGMAFGYEVVNESTGVSYVLEEVPVNLSIYPKDGNGVQQINHHNGRGFKLEVGNNKNWVKVIRDGDNDSGNEVAYKAFFATKIRWEHWLQRENVPDEYYDNGLPNNGHHNNWLDYLRSKNGGGHKMDLFVRTEIVEAGEVKTHRNTYPLDFNGYDENLDIETQHNYYRHSDGMPLNIGSDPETGKTLGVILGDGPTRLEITYTHLFEDFDIGRMYAVTTLEVDKGAGEFEHRQLSSVWGSEPDNPLVPLPGDTNLTFEQLSPRMLRATCLVDPIKLGSAKKYKVSGRIGCWPEGDSTTVDGKYETRYEPKYE